MQQILCGVAVPDLLDAGAVLGIVLFVEAYSKGFTNLIGHSDGDLPQIVWCSVSAVHAGV
jgi:hypothetical protein